MRIVLISKWKQRKVKEVSSSFNYRDNLIMIKGFGFILLFALVLNFGFAQTRQAVDSCTDQLASAKDDTSRINAQIALCLLYRLGNTDSSLMYGEQALESAERINYIPGQISALGFMCIVTEQRGNLPKSLELGFKGATTWGGASFRNSNGTCPGWYWRGLHHTERLSESNKLFA
jgi:hypothetical protein